MSRDGSRLFVTETLSHKLRIYRRDAGSGRLRFEKAIELDSAPGNLNVGDDDIVWIAAYPKLFSLASHMKDPAKQAPTQILRFDPKLGSVSQVYADDGAAISAGSSAAPWQHEFLIGAMLDRKVLLCKPRP